MPAFNEKMTLWQRIRYEKQLLRTRVRLFWYGPVILRNTLNMAQEIGADTEFLVDDPEETQQYVDAGGIDLIGDIKEHSDDMVELIKWAIDYPNTEIVGKPPKPGSVKKSWWLDPCM